MVRAACHLNRDVFTKIYTIIKDKFLPFIIWGTWNFFLFWVQDFMGHIFCKYTIPLYSIFSALPHGSYSLWVLRKLTLIIPYTMAQFSLIFHMFGKKKKNSSWVKIAFLLFTKHMISILKHEICPVKLYTWQSVLL